MSDEVYEALTSRDPFVSEFETAAQAEAEAVMREARERVGITVREQARYIEGHVAGAEWARTHLAEQEPTDAEAVAYLAAFVEDLSPGEGDEWTPDTIARVKRGLRVARRDEEKR